LVVFFKFWVLCDRNSQEGDQLVEFMLDLVEHIWVGGGEEGSIYLVG
jgi:hypothetical protein